MVTTHNCRVQRECREELNMGPECPSTSMSLLMRVNTSESGAFHRGSLLPVNEAFKVCGLARFKFSGSHVVVYS